MMRKADDSLVRLLRARDLLAERPASLAEAAYEACMSPYHFHRQFQAAFSQTPHEFVTDRRVNRARRLLASTDLPVTTICMEVGYASLGTFSATFRRHVGVSPSEFRMQIRRSWAVGGWRTHRFVPACFLALRMARNGKIEEAPLDSVALR